LLYGCTILVGTPAIPAKNILGLRCDELRGWLTLQPLQSAGCAPIVRAFQEGTEASIFWQGAATVASGLRVPKPLGDFLVLQVLRDSGGTALAIDDAAVLAALAQTARR
jgi:threonine synthase